MPSGRHHSVVKTDYHQFLLRAGAPRELIHGEDPIFPLAIFAGDTIVVRVGIRYGPVNVEVELLEEDPGADSYAEWEDVVEGDLVQQDGYQLKVGTLWDFDPDYEDEVSPPITGLTPSGGRRFRVRICARGRNVRFDDVNEGDPFECYLIQLWPTNTEFPPIQIKNESGR